MIVPQLKPAQLRWLMAGVALSLGIAAWLVGRFLSPAPPGKVTLTSGAVDGAYHQFAQKYAAALAENGIKVEITPSGGSVENIARLESGAASIGFVQGGLGSLSTQPDADADDLPLRSLGVVAFEPLWVFSAMDLDSGLNSLAGKRVAVGAEGSGARKVALDLLAQYGLDASKLTLVPQGGAAAAAALTDRRVDAFITIAAPQSPTVQTLLAQPTVKLANFAQADGIARRLPYLQTVTLRRGSLSPANNQPSKDVTLLATTANLVVRADLHPALASLLLEAAKPIHRGASLFNGPSDFPSPKGVDFVLSNEAQRYYKDGRPFLQRYLPFWLANFVQRLILIVVPLVAILVPLLKTLPELMDIRDRSRLFRRYGELMFLENDLRARQLSADEITAGHQKLKDIEDDIARAKFPLDFADRVFTLRQHVDFVRAQLNLEVQAAP